MALITCRDVSLGYDGKTVIEGLNFTVNSGDYLCIVGENGSGKSTLMKALLRLKAPLSGEISMGEGLKQTDIGYLPQQTVVQKDFPASVYEIVLSGCQRLLGMRPFFGRRERAMATSCMQKMGIENLSGKCYRELSGGQQQRVLLARALCATQKVLLLDEPVTGLDPKVTAEMYALIERLNREEGITVIMVSHDIATAVKYASHILHVGNSPLFFGTKEEYLRSDVGKSFISSEGERQE